jgi:hypothetical protein
MYIAILLTSLPVAKFLSYSSVLNFFAYPFLTNKLIAY